MKLPYCIQGMHEHEKELLEKWFDFVLVDRKIRDQYDPEFDDKKSVDAIFDTYYSEHRLKQTYEWLCKSSKLPVNIKVPRKTELLEYMTEPILNNVKYIYNDFFKENGYESE